MESLFFFLPSLIGIKLSLKTINNNHFKLNCPEYPIEQKKQFLQMFRIRSFFRIGGVLKIQSRLYSTAKLGLPGRFSWKVGLVPLVGGSVVTLAALKTANPTYSSEASVEKPNDRLELEDQKMESQELTATAVYGIVRHIRHSWAMLVLIVLVTGVSAAINVKIPLVIGQLITVLQSLLDGVGSADLSLLNGPALQLMGLFGTQGLLTFVDIALISKLGEDLAASLRRELFSVLLSQDIAFFDSHMHGEIVSRLTQDISDFKHTFKLCVTQGLKCVAQIVGSGYSLLNISPSLTLTLVSTMPVIYLFMNVYGTYLRHLSKKARLTDSQSIGIAGEALMNIRTVRAFAAEDTELAKYMDAYSRSASMNRYLGFHIGLFQGITNASVGGLILMILFYGGKLVGKKELTGGQLMAYMVSTQNTQKSLALVGVLFGQVIKALGSASRIFEYMNIQPTIPTKGGLVPRHIEGTIEFKDVSFAYPTRSDHPILERFSLLIPNGKVVAVCGPSGGGKSTLGQLIERFYEPDNGEVLLDNTNIKQLDPAWLRSHIGYINQEPTLFASTILDNIRYGKPDATDAEVYEAARQANAAEFIERFPNKYNTIVGERGSTLSGGQRQRIAIARAILKDPQVLILDEATSALDITSERLVQDALDRLMKGRTVLVIAHRLSTIQNADLIVVMTSKGKESSSSGNIVEFGTHAELLDRRGVYYSMFQRSEM